MICTTVTGYLAAAPKSAFTNATGEVFRIRLATNHNHFDSKTKTWQKQTIWCSGLVSGKKIGVMAPFFVKGAPVVISSSDVSLNFYTAHDGTQKCDLDLGYVDRIEAYQRLPRPEGGIAGQQATPPNNAAPMSQYAAQAATQQQEATVAQYGAHSDELPPLL